MLTDRSQAQRMLDGWLTTWAQDGYGYWLAQDSAGEVVGLAGVRPAGDHANVAYRFAVRAQGRGLATEAARTAIATATEWLELPARALVAEVNEPSVATALAAGLERAGTARHPDQPAQEAPATVFEAPSVRAATAFDDTTSAQVLDLWCRVNDAGGAVGFLPGASRERVAAALREHALDK